MYGRGRFRLHLDPLTPSVAGKRYKLDAGLQLPVPFGQIAHEPRTRRDFRNRLGRRQFLCPLAALLDECFEFGASEHLQMQQRAGRLGSMRA
ncbi:hypothetical protein WT33_01615 [Burkholderia stagnalis]|nr:hypothetical protein WT33_01615 [Burkholderia stagnalis]